MNLIENKFAQNFDLKPVDLPTVSLNDIHVLPCLSQAAMGGATRRTGRGIILRHTWLTASVCSSLHGV